MSEPLLFALPSYRAMADEILALGGLERGEVERKTFPDGERYQRILTPVAGRRVLILGGTWCDQATLTLYDLACAVAKHGAHALTLVIPYFGYSTMERAVHRGDVVTAKTRARLLSAVPPADAGNHVVLFDLHSEGIPHYFEGGVTPRHVYGKPVVLDAIRDAGGADAVLGCTDAGRAKWVQSLANDLGLTPAFVFKRRLDGARTEITAVSAQVEGRPVVIYDDMIRTGGSLLEAARAYREAGATRVAAVATHAVLPGGALERIRDSGLVERVITTDSHPRARELEGDFLEVRPVASLLRAAALEGTA